MFSSVKMDLIAIDRFGKLLIFFLRQKRKVLVYGALVFFICNYSTLQGEEPTDQRETDRKQRQTEPKCEYSIPGIGTLYLDQPVDQERGCDQKKSSKVRREVVMGNKRVSSIIGTPLEIHEFNQKNINSSSKDLYSIYLPVNGQRALPDFRTDLCRSKGMFIKRLPRASIIVPMHNVAWPVLIRMVQSAITTTPIELLEEIIIVDDASTMEYLKTELDSYFMAVKKVKILRIPERVGFFQVRNKGADLASAPVLIFLDANTECSPGWVEPLLERIALNRSIIASPSMDIIDQDTGKYSLVLPESVGGFGWNLVFTWKGLTDNEIQESNLAEPLKTPNLPSGNFAVDKEFFSILGQHDPVMDTLEFDNLELSVKSWLCGGSLEIVPCSHVGQVEDTYEPDDMAGYKNMILNISIRAAEVWFDEYKSYFYDRVGEPSIEIGDLSKQLLIKKDLMCHPFTWYLENVYPDLFIPGQSRAAGEVRNPWSMLCIDSAVNNMDPSLPVSLFPCHSMGGHQYWMLSPLGEIRRDEACLDYAGHGQGVGIYPCHGSRGNQEWVMDRSRIFHRQSRMCLTVSGNDTPSVPLSDQPEVRFVTLAECREESPKQEWIWFWQKT